MGITLYHTEDGYLMDSHVVLLVLFFLSDMYFFGYAVAGRRGGRDKMAA